MIYQKAPSRPELTADGRVIGPANVKNLPLVLSMPGAVWDSNRKWWWVSLAPQDRPRVLKAASQLGLEVAPSLRSVEPSQEACRAEAAGLFPFQVEGVDWLAGCPPRAFGR
jgi:hypothetical protein